MKKNEFGILIQRYGPHTLHTSFEDVYQYILRFADWEPYRLLCEVDMLGQTTPSPFNFKTIDQYYSQEKAEKLKQQLLRVYPNRQTVTIVELLQSEVNEIREYAQFLFNNDYSLYTAKQWGIQPSEIDVNVLRRVPVRLGYEEGYFTDKYECMPKGGFAQFIQNILNHENISVRTNADVLDCIQIDNNHHTISFADELRARESCMLVYTGAIDELFGYCYGALPYRSLRFEYKNVAKNSYQNAAVVAYPAAKDYTRITEYTKLPYQEIDGRTTIVVEYPLQYKAGTTSDPYYPIPTEQSANQYAQYKALANTFSQLILCGRLAEFKYYNMDQAIKAVLDKVK